MTTMTAQTTQIYQVFIKASAEEIWEAITKPEFTERYFYGARISVTPDGYRGLGPADEVWGDSAVTEFDPRSGSSTAGAPCTTPSWPRRRRAA